MNTLFRALVIALLAAVVIASGAATGGCADMGSHSVRGSGVVATQSRGAAGFNEIRLSGSGDVTVDLTGTESLTVEAEDNLLPLLDTTVENGVLHLGVKKGASIQTTRPIRYRVTAQTLTAIGVSGSGSFRITGLDADRFSADISGSGSADLAGRADDVNLSISGSGDYDAAALRAKTVRINISGSGNANVNASNRLEANVSGSGSVRYARGAAVQTRISGSGTVAPR
jgi:hypothetical protein